MQEEVKFAFSSRTQLDEVLNKFISAFADEDFKSYVKMCGNGDFDTVNDIIQKKQKEILQECGVDPEAGINDLAKVKDHYPKSDPTMQKLVFVALREEALINEVIASHTNPSFKSPIPNTMEEMAVNLQRFPAMMDDLKVHLQQNPEVVKNMTPQQQEMLKQMILAQQKIRDAQQQMQQQQQQPQQQNQQNQQQQQNETPSQSHFDIQNNQNQSQDKAKKPEYKSTIIGKTMSM